MDIQLDDAWIEQHKSDCADLLFKDPWTDKVAKKAGLVQVYICDALCEAMNLQAELNPKISLNNPNPQHKAFIGLCNTLNKALGAWTKIESPADGAEAAKVKESFLALHAFIEKYMGGPVSYGQFTNFMPDIRRLETISECLSWIYTHYGLRTLSLGCLPVAL